MTDTDRALIEGLRAHITNLEARLAAKDMLVGDGFVQSLHDALDRQGSPRKSEDGMITYGLVQRIDLMRADISGVWQQAENNHRIYSDTGDKERDIQFLTLGLTGEAGEVANFVKKRWRDGDGHDADIRKEIADVCAYAFMLANTMGMAPRDLIDTIAEKQAVFVAKMDARAALQGDAS